MIEIRASVIDEALQQLNPRIYQKTLNRTLNDIGSKMKTKMTKDIRKTYNIQAKDIKKYMKIKRSRFDDMKYEIEVKSERRNVVRFGSRVLKKKGMISVRIRKDKGRKKLRNSFLSKDKKAVLHRMGRTQKIEAVKTLSITQMFNKKIVETGVDTATTEFNSKLEANFNFYFGRA